MLPSDYEPKPTGRKPWRLLGFLPFVIILLGLGCWPLLDLLIKLDTRERTEAIAPAQVAAHVAGHLMQWGVFGNIPESTAVRQAVVWRLRGVHGLSMRGWNNEGADWYEVELTPDLAAEIKAGLARLESRREPPPANFLTSPFRKCSTSTIPFGPRSPPWWPERWPDGLPAYAKNHTYLVLAPDGSRAWLLAY